MLKVELSKRGIPFRVTIHGSKASPRSDRGSKGIFSQDIYVPENKYEESREILYGLGWTKNEVEVPKKPAWLKIYAFIIIIALAAYAIYLLKILELTK